MRDSEILLRAMIDAQGRCLKEHSIELIKRYKEETSVKYLKGEIKKSDCSDDVVVFEEECLIKKIETYKSILSPREYGSFKASSYYLNADYNWVIIKDEQNTLCLVPTKKK